MNLNKSQHNTISASIASIVRSVRYSVAGITKTPRISTNRIAWGREEVTGLLVDLMKPRLSLRSLSFPSSSDSELRAMYSNFRWSGSLKREDLKKEKRISSLYKFNQFHLRESLKTRFVTIFYNFVFQHGESPSV